MNEEEIKSIKEKIKELKDKLPKETDWIEEAIIYEATPKSLREPKKKEDFIKKLGIGRSTYFKTMSLKENVDKIVDLSFKRAKKRTPEVVDKLGQNAEAGDSTSIGQFMEYILQIKKRLELSGDKDNPIKFDIELKKEIEEKLKNVINED